MRVRRPRGMLLWVFRGGEDEIWEGVVEQVLRSEILVQRGL